MSALVEFLELGLGAGFSAELEKMAVCGESFVFVSAEEECGGLCGAWCGESASGEGAPCGDGVLCPGLEACQEDCASRESEEEERGAVFWGAEFLLEGVLEGFSGAVFGVVVSLLSRGQLVKEIGRAHV